MVVTLSFKPLGNHQTTDTRIYPAVCLSTQRATDINKLNQPERPPPSLNCLVVFHSVFTATAEPTTPPTTEPATEAIHVPDIEDADPTDPVESSKTVVVGLGKYPLIPKTEVIPFTTSKSSLDAVDRVNGGKKLSGKDGAKTSSEAGCTRPISQLLVAMTGIAMAMILLA